MKDRATYVTYRIARAHESLDEAQLLFDAGHYNTCINRLYYACFYAVNGLLFAHRLNAARHDGVLRLFSEHFIRTGILPESTGTFIRRLFQLRQRSDYDDTFLPDPKIVSKWIPQTKSFVEQIERTLACAGSDS